MRKFKGIVLFTLLFAFSALYITTIGVKCPTYAPAIAGCFMVFMAYLSYLFYGYPKFEATPIKVTVIRGTIAMIIIYFIVIYLLGSFAGIDKVVPDLTCLISIITIVATEIFRYIYINGNNDDGLQQFLATLGIIVLQTACTFDITTTLELNEILFYVITIFAPLLLRNFVLTFLAHHIDYKLGIVYAILVTQYMNFIPVVPKLGDFFRITSDVILSFLILVVGYRVIIKNYEGYSMITLKDGFNFFDVVIFILFAALGIMISGFTPIQIFAETQNSTISDIKKGDGPVVLKGVKSETIKKDDIIVYKKNSDDPVKFYLVTEKEEYETVVNSKKEMVYNVYINNDDGEKILVSDKQIYGKVLFNAKMIFVPALYIQDQFDRGVAE